jgi:hypothetical protein
MMFPGKVTSVASQDGGVRIFYFGAIGVDVAIVVARKDGQVTLSTFYDPNYK